MFDFVQFVTSLDMFQMQGEQTRCPYKKHKCKVFKFLDDVMRDLYEEGLCLIITGGQTTVRSYHNFL